MSNIWQRIDDSWAAHDHVRHWMYESLYTVLAKLDWQSRAYRLLEFGCREPTSSIIRMLTYIGIGLLPTVVEYPDVDCQSTPYSDNSWDIVVADQVLEHVERPWVAADEICRITAPGGLAIICTPFMHPLHPCPLDCWRIAPDGYRVLFPESRWETLVLDMWGDGDVIFWEYASNQGLSGDWVSVKKAQDLMGAAYQAGNDKKNPVVIWGIFRKR